MMTKDQAYEETQVAYMRDDFSDGAWRKVFEFLLKEGHAPAAAAAIMLSKHVRWADDSQGRGEGKGTNSAAFIRYYKGVSAVRQWPQEGLELARQTFGVESVEDDVVTR